MAMEQKIPQATAKRIPLYYRFLINLHTQGKMRVSSKELSEAIKVDSATIRRDFSYLGAIGKKGYGYDINYLLDFFKQVIEQDKGTEVAVIGVGNLGMAFLNYHFIRKNNMRISMAFDSSAEKVGTEITGVPIYHIDDLAEKLKNVEVVILTVPGSEAQEITNQITELGVKGILNFTPARLTIPADVRIHHIDLSMELQSFVYLLKNYPME